MSKPIISGSSFVFDAAKTYTFSFTYSGSTVYGYDILVTDKITSGTVYNAKVTSRILQCTIPANKLKNGKTYFVQIAAIDSQGKLSSYSNKVYAICHEAPTLAINITDSQRITTSYVELTATFTQPSGTDAFKTCKFYLYDSNGTTLLSESVELYPSTNIQEYKFLGLENDSTCYLRCMGQSVSGFELDTGLVRINVLQSDFKTYNTFYVENKQGGIQYDSNLIVIAPDDSADYVCKDSMVDLVGKEMTYNSGFEIPDNFTLLWLGTHFDLNSTTREGEIEILRFPENNASLKLHILQTGIPADNEEDRMIFASFCIPQEQGDVLIFSNVRCFNDAHDYETINDSYYNFEHFQFKIWLKKYNNYWSLKFDLECRESCEEGRIYDL